MDEVEISLSRLTISSAFPALFACLLLLTAATEAEELPSKPSNGLLRFSEEASM